MKRRFDLFNAMMVALLPVPVVAFGSGVVGMAEAEKYEQQHHTVAQWAVSELLRIETGFRQMLEPIYPQPKGFNIVDAQIADIVAQGELEHTRLSELIEQIESRLEAPEPHTSQGAVVYESSSNNENLTEVDSVVDTFTSPEFVPEVEVMRDDGTLLAIDTSEGVDLPDLTIDPRNGGTYESEIEAIEPALEVLQAIQDQVPAPIQTAGNDLYNQITGTQKPDDNT